MLRADARERWAGWRIVGMEGWIAAEGAAAAVADIPERLADWKTSAPVIGDENTVVARVAKRVGTGTRLQEVFGFVRKAEAEAEMIPDAEAEVQRMMVLVVVTPGSSSVVLDSLHTAVETFHCAYVAFVDG